MSLRLSAGFSPRAVHASHCVAYVLGNGRSMKRAPRERASLHAALALGATFAAAYIAMLALGTPVANANPGALEQAATPPNPPAIYGLRGALADRPDPASASSAAVPATAAIPTGRWQPLGPAPSGPPYLQGGDFYAGPNSGRITALVNIPSGLHSGRVVAGTAGGGIWTSDDGGTTWTPRTDSAANLAIGAVALDPSNANHLVAGTGEANQSADSFAGSGILVSTNGGSTWSLQNPGGVFTGLHVAQVAIDPSNASHEFAATDGGLFVTTNGGGSWAKPSDPSYAGVDGRITAVAIDPATPATVYVAGGAETVAKSTDGGVNWAAANTGITTSGSLTALAVAASAPTTLYVSVGSSDPVALYKSTNGGGSWTKLTAAPDYTGGAYAYGSGSGDQGWYDNTVAVDPTNADHLIAGGITAVESGDGGGSWTNVNGGGFFTKSGPNLIHPDVHAFAFRPDGTVWVGTDGGVYRYTPSSGAVTNANGNLNITQLYHGFSALGNAVLAGSQDNASMRTESSALGPWTAIWAGDGGATAITPNHTSTQFIESNRSPLVTTDAFATTLNGMNPPQLGLFTPPMIVVPSNATPADPTVFYGGPDLYRTTNPSAATPSWTRVTSVGAEVSAIAASPSNSQVVYVGFANGTIAVSTDGGISFTNLAAAPTSETFVTGLSVNPSNPKAITASFSYYDTRYAGGFPHVAQYVYSSSPGSGTWTTIDGNLPNAAVSRVVYDNGALVAGTDQGVYATGAPAGSSTVWSRVGTRLPNVQVQDLIVQSKGLYVATHGRGAWRLPSGTPLSLTLKPPTATNRVGSSHTVTATLVNSERLDRRPDDPVQGDGCQLCLGLEDDRQQRQGVVHLHRHERGPGQDHRLLRCEQEPRLRLGRGQGDREEDLDGEASTVGRPGLGGPPYGPVIGVLREGPVCRTSMRISRSLPIRR